MKKNYLCFQMKVFIYRMTNFCDNIDLKTTPEGLNKKLK